MPDSSPQRHRASLSWSGSTGAGWSSYERRHVGLAPPAKGEIELTTGESHGDPSLMNPEQLVTIAAASCQMLVFLHLAAKARADVVGYEDVALATMAGEAAGAPGLGRIDLIELRPRIAIAGVEPPDERLERLVELAHEHCYVANSLRCEVRIEPSFERVARAGDGARTRS